MYPRFPGETVILMARHGETVWNVVHRMQGQKDSPLTPKGVEQAQALLVKLITIEQDWHEAGKVIAVWSSSLGRARKTAEICAKGLDIGLTITENLNEIALGQWEGLTFEEAEKNSPEQFYNFWHRPSLYVPPRGGETFPEVQKRMLHTLKNIHERHHGKTVLVVSHWIAIKAAIAALQESGLDSVHSIPVIENGSFHIVRMTGDKAKVEYNGGKFPASVTV